MYDMRSCGEETYYRRTLHALQCVPPNVRPYGTFVPLTPFLAVKSVRFDKEAAKRMRAVWPIITGKHQKLEVISGAVLEFPNKKL
jgi:hypothetical protein